MQPRVARRRGVVAGHLRLDQAVGPVGGDEDLAVVGQSLDVEPGEVDQEVVLVGRRERDLRDAGLWGIKMKGSLTLKAGTEAIEVDPRLDMRPTDSLLVKKYASCFFGTDLVSRLMNQRVDTLIITGCTTSGCVRATAVDAVQNGFRPMVVREAVGDRSAPAHEQSLFDLNAKYADVVGLDETLQYMRTVGHNAPAR